MAAVFCPLLGGLPSWVPSGALRSPNSRSYGPRSTIWPGSRPSACAPGPHQRPGGSPPAFAGLDVIPGRVLGRALVDLAPDVVQVVALDQGRDYCQAGLCRRGPEAAELTTIVR